MRRRRGIGHGDLALTRTRKKRQAKRHAGERSSMSLSNVYKFFGALNWKQHSAFVMVYALCYMVCYHLTHVNPEWFSQSCLGMLDNGPLIYLGLLGMDSEGPIMKWFEGLPGGDRWMGWLKNPVFLVVFINALINTITDGIGAIGDPVSSVVGVTFGCLCVMVILPITWVLRS